MLLNPASDRNVKDASRRYAVCPLSLPPVALERLCARGRDRQLTEFECVCPCA